MSAVCLLTSGMILDVLHSEAALRGRIHRAYQNCGRYKIRVGPNVFPRELFGPVESLRVAEKNGDPRSRTTLTGARNTSLLDRLNRL
jgi:hypothetical protein